MISAFLGNLFFALLVGCIGFAAAYWLVKNKKL